MRSRETILVVEDTDEIRRLVCSMLALQGYNCLAAADGVEALQLIENGSDPVQLVLTDMIMPNMMGTDLARHLARERPEIRIVLMSGFCDDPIVRVFERIPAIFIAKPFTAAALYDKVRGALDQPWSGLPELCPDSSQR